jgi:hypothetical protein
VQWIWQKMSSAKFPKNVICKISELQNFQKMSSAKLRKPHLQIFWFRRKPHLQIFPTANFSNSHLQISGRSAVV